MSTVQSDLLTVIVGIVALLSAASGLGFVLARRAPANAAIENLNDRITAWWVMSAAISLAFLGGRAGVVALFGLASFAALREFMTLTAAKSADHKSLVAAFFLVLPAQFGLVWWGWYGLYSIFIPVYVFLFLPIISALSGETRAFLIRVAQMQWALMICVFCLSHVPALLNLEISGYAGRNVLLIAYLVIVVQMSDVLQYVWGKLIGGALSATALGTSLFWMTPFSPLAAAGMSLILTMMGFLGGLVMSAIKRDRGVKDWGHTIAGHGGFIDRLDSVLFAAPVFFHLTRYFWSVN